MDITNLRRQSGAGTLVAVFDLRVTPEITLTDWQLRQTPKGLRAFPAPGRGGRWTAQIAPRAFSRIGRLASAAFSAMEGIAPHDRPVIGAEVD